MGRTERTRGTSWWGKTVAGTVFLGAAALTGSGHVQSSAAPAQAALRSFQFSRVLDLSHVIGPDMPLWPGDPPVQFNTVATLKKDGYFLRSFSMGEHSGTHMNAPGSFAEGGASITRYRPEQLVLPAVVIDVRDQTARNPDYALTKQRVLNWEQQHGRIPRGSLVLLYTGWQARWGNPKAFFNQDKAGGLHFPGFDGATTAFLLRERGIAGVGIDTHGVDPGQDESYATNTQVLRGGGIVLECLTQLDQLPPTGTTLVIGLLRLKGGSGTPVAVTAFLP